MLFVLYTATAIFYGLLCYCTKDKEIAQSQESKDKDTVEKQNRENIEKVNPKLEVRRQKTLYELTIRKLKLALCGKRVTPQEAKDILKINSGTNAEIFFQHLCYESDNVYHIFDKDSRKRYKEFIVFVHPRHDAIAYYKIIPFFFDHNMSYTVCSVNEFINTNIDDLYICENYRVYSAIRKIQKACTGWLDKPVTNDGKPGIRCRLGWEKVAQLNAQV